MNDVQSLTNTAWASKYYLVWISKYRKKEIFGSLRKYLGETFRELACIDGRTRRRDGEKVHPKTAGERPSDSST